jgi:spastic paraplegia protein 7
MFVVHEGCTVLQHLTNSIVVFQLAETLLKKETLNYDDVEKLIGPPPFGKKSLIGPAEFEESVNTAAGEEESKQQQKQQRQQEQSANNFSSVYYK